MHLVVVELGDVLLADAVNKDGGGEGEEGEESPGSKDHGGVLRAYAGGASSAGGAGDAGGAGSAGGAGDAGGAGSAGGAHYAGVPGDADEAGGDRAGAVHIL